MNIDDTNNSQSETTGQILKRKLGLSNFKHTRVCRVLGATRRVLYVFFNSYKPNKFIPKMDTLKVPRTAALFLGDILDEDENTPLEYLKTTVLTDLETYNGFVNSNTFIILIDLAGVRYCDDKLLSRRVKESIDLQEQESVSVFRVKKLDEGITLYDLTKNAGMSNFTKYFATERGKIMGNENTVSKLAKCEINEKEGYVDFFFISDATEKYKASHKFKEVDPMQNFSLIANPNKTYMFMIRILNFFEWLEAAGDLSGVFTDKDLKEVLEVAEIQIFDTSPMFHWQGASYNLSQLDASIYPTDIPPNIWNSRKNKYTGETHSGNQLLSKYGQKIINQISFFLNPMSSMLSKVLRDKQII